MGYNKIDRMCVPVTVKPFKGAIKDWKFIKWFGNDMVLGQFVEHPEFAGKRGHTSIILNKDYREDGIMVETMNSKYYLPYNEEEPDPEFWGPGRN
jgi:hypothetical protein